MHTIVQQAKLHWNKYTGVGKLVFIVMYWLNQSETIKQKNSKSASAIHNYNNWKYGRRAAPKLATNLMLLNKNSEQLCTVCSVYLKSAYFINSNDV